MIRKVPTSDSGMLINMISTERGLPKNSRVISATMTRASNSVLVTSNRAFSTYLP